MARAIETIEQDIAALEAAVELLAAELKNNYTSYLTNLGQAVRKQLILASYHLCTQAYPEAFLSLSLNQRQKLQQGIRKLGQQAAAQLLAVLQPVNLEVEAEVDTEEEDVETAPTLVETEPEDEQQESEIDAAELSNPILLLKWQQCVEKTITIILKMLSHDTNHLLQQAGILPKKLPEPLLEMAAASSEAFAETMPGPPNLLNLVIEVENEQKPEEAKITQIMALNLRLVEIEFADTIVNSGRNQIRNLLNQLQKLEREYHKRQRERAVAEAESAWRASWFE